MKKNLIIPFVFTVLQILLPFSGWSESGQIQAEGALASEAHDFRNVAKTAIPAVVSIKVKGAEKAVSLFEDGDSGSDDSFGEEFWQRFFGVKRRGGASKESQPTVGQASGFIISPDGYILTNSHVVKDMSEITVALNDGREFPAKLIGQDPNTDVALLKIDAKELPFLKLGKVDDLEVGQWVVAIGNPMGLQASLTVGVVSATGRNNLDLSRIEDYIQTDAAINRGNSGGPLLNLNSEVVGMNTAIVTNMATGGYMGIGFAIPSSILKSVMDDLKSDGKFKRGFLGITLQSVDEGLAQAFGLDKAAGALVADISKDSPAQKFGIQQGDIILKYDGRVVNNIGNLRNAISLMKPGAKVQLSILRNGKPVEVTVEVGLFPDATAEGTTIKQTELGIEVDTLTPKMASELGITADKGVIISKVDPRGVAAWAGIKAGSLVLEVNKRKIATLDEFNSALQETEKGRPLLLLIKHGEITRFVSFKIN